MTKTSSEVLVSCFDSSAQNAQEHHHHHHHSNESKSLIDEFKLESKERSESASDLINKLNLKEKEEEEEMNEKDVENKKEEGEEKDDDDDDDDQEEEEEEEEDSTLTISNPSKETNIIDLSLINSAHVCAAQVRRSLSLN